MTTRMTAKQRFFVKVALPNETGCMLWTGHIKPNGYGQFGLAPGRQVHAHRFAYELLVEPIPAGLQLDHLCRVRNCVAPDHLEPVTHRENTLRGDAPTAQHARQTHCVNGHPLAGDNLVRSEIARGRRQCRTCQRASQKRYNAKRKLIGRPNGAEASDG